MRLVISIVSWNCKELLTSCLRSITPFLNPDRDVLVVFDNASKDGTPDMVRAQFPHVVVIETGANLGFGKAHNLVRKHFESDFVLFLNPDAEFREPAHERMLEIFEKHPKVGAVGCGMLHPDGPLQELGLQWYPTPWTELVASFLVTQRSMQLLKPVLPVHDSQASGLVNKLYGGCLMVRTKALEEIGWFDERYFMYCEDVEISYDLRRKGWQLFYTADARVVHLVGGSSRKAGSHFSALMQRESVSKFIAKWQGPLSQTLYRAVVLAGSTLRAAVSCLAFALVFWSEDRRQSVHRSLQKHVAIAQWALGVRRPKIPS